VIGVMVMSVDIQHLKDVERDLAQRERQLALINENAREQEAQLRFFAEEP
jgi:hypothetical protein